MFNKSTNRFPERQNHDHFLYTQYSPKVLPISKFEKEKYIYVYNCRWEVIVVLICISLKSLKINIFYGHTAPVCLLWESLCLIFHLLIRFFVVLEFSQCFLCPGYDSFLWFVQLILLFIFLFWGFCIAAVVSSFMRLFDWKYFPNVNLYELPLLLLLYPISLVANLLKNFFLWLHLCKFAYR